MEIKLQDETAAPEEETAMPEAPAEETAMPETPATDDDAGDEAPATEEGGETAAPEAPAEEGGAM